MARVKQRIAQSGRPWIVRNQLSMAVLRCLLWCISETLFYKIWPHLGSPGAVLECWCPSRGYFLAALCRPLAAQLLGLRLGCAGYGLLQTMPAQPPIRPAPGLPLLFSPLLCLTCSGSAAGDVRTRPLEAKRLYVVLHIVRTRHVPALYRPAA